MKIYGLFGRTINIKGGTIAIGIQSAKEGPRVCQPTIQLRGIRCKWLGLGRLKN